jgi:hypothetical protein
MTKNCFVCFTIGDKKTFGCHTNGDQNFLITIQMVIENGLWLPSKKFHGLDGNQIFLVASN